jgi:glycosyltransferase involved in cell wall biosynthesis
MISCILCTRNPRRDYLARALKSLSDQSFPVQQRELLVVDNGSQPPLGELPGWPNAASARIVVEAQPGLTPARLCGIRESRGELLVFVDDDNLLVPDYLAQAAALDTEFQKVAVWSGNIMPEFEHPPPEWTKRYWHVMALRPVERNVWSNSYFSETLPIGAGMVVRRLVAERYAEQLAAHPERLALDRQGQSLLAAGDTDLGFGALDLGFACGVARELRLTHLIPSSRLEEEYLVRLARSVTHSHTLLSLLRRRTTYSGAQLRRKQARYLRCCFDWDAHRRRYHKAIAAGAIAGMKDFRRRMSGGLA